MYSIGQRLREERLRKGIKLSEISEFTRIRTAFLEAIENDQFDQLPGAFYARSFIRQYARYIGLDDPELEAEIKRQLGEPGPVVSAQEVLTGLSVSGPEKSPVLWRTQPASRWLAYVTVAGLVVAGILGVYLGWRQVRVRAEAELHAIRPAETTVAPVTPQPAVQPPASTLPGPAPTAGPAPAPQPAIAGPAETAQPARAAESTPERQSLVVEIRAQKDSWIQVHSDEKVVFVGTLRSGQARTFEASERIRILTGNAGGLQVLRNGSPLGPIGPEGQVRTVEITKETYRISGPRPKPPEAEPKPSAEPPSGETPPPLAFNPQ
jgi:cytoskeleton protein RodZ